MKTVWLLSVFFTFLVGVSQAAEDQKPSLSIPPLTIRYIWFTATPKPGAVFTPQELERPTETRGLVVPPVFEKLAKGLDVPLTDDAEAFLKELQKEEPRYTFRIHLFGTAYQTDKKRYRILDASEGRHPFQYIVSDEVRVLRRQSATALRIRHSGEMKQQAAKTSGLATQVNDWDDTYAAEGRIWEVGKTVAVVTNGLPPDESNIYALCIQEHKPSTRR